MIDVTLFYSPSSADSTIFQFGRPGFGGQKDNEIRIATGAKSSLRDLLLALYNQDHMIKALNPGACISIEDFYDAAGKFLPREEVRQEVEKFMLRGRPIELQSTNIAPPFHISVVNNIPVLSITDSAGLKQLFQW